MPFTGVSAMDLELEFVRLALADDANKRQRGQRFGVSAGIRACVQPHSARRLRRGRWSTGTWDPHKLEVSVTPGGAATVEVACPWICVMTDAADAPACCADAWATS